jgi:hypothetical protein
MHEVYRPEVFYPEFVMLKVVDMINTKTYVVIIKPLFTIVYSGGKWFIQTMFSAQNL